MSVLVGRGDVDLVRALGGVPQDPRDFAGAFWEGERVADPDGASEAETGVEQVAVHDEPVDELLALRYRAGHAAEGTCQIEGRAA